ncbi:MAG: transcriptional repressor [Candidatus Bathyarchaeota archaeon]|nr:transcriptional repressor [Candidatus Bathyarchaeota archaeon]
MQDQLKSDAVIIQALRNKGYKATPQRISVCKIALSSKEHPSVQKICKEVKKTHPTVSLATVYTTLRLLKESSLIQELNFPQGQTRFDPNLEPHINLVCIHCGRIMDVNDSEAKELINKVTKKAKFTPKAQRIDIYGVCQHCSKIDNAKS